MGTKLTISNHAEGRMHWRGISADDVMRVIRTGQRYSFGERVLHYDRGAKLGVIVNWREMVVVTVMHLNSFVRWRLKVQEPQP